MTMHATNQPQIYLEIGKKKIFACSLDWPGWCRAGRDEASAVQALIGYAPRYSKIIELTGLEFPLLEKATDFNIVERIEGNYATDFGVPDLPIQADTIPLSDSDIPRFAKILNASWLAFDEAAKSAKGKELRKGPRGGGRDLDEIVAHVTKAEKGYLRRLGWDGSIPVEGTSDQLSLVIHNEILESIPKAFHGQFPPQGIRGGKRWPLPYFVRRVAWHVIDHTWEIEDRVV